MDEIYSSLSYILSRAVYYLNNSKIVDIFLIAVLLAMPSLTATLLHYHVLVVPQGQIVTLEVQHGQRAETRWDT